MAASPKYKVYCDGIYIASCKDVYDALAIIEMRGAGSIKVHHNKLVYDFDIDGSPIDPSWDASAKLALDREVLPSPFFFQGG
jgi:hypothetical protein